MIFQVNAHYQKAGTIILDSFDSQSEALLFAREAADLATAASGDTLVSVTVYSPLSKKTVSTFYPDFYEAESLDDDDDG